ncbi:MAG: RDD family protein [Pirellulaceae bacterium]|nr:RDD family protein [Pirellulaceae bacterium]
MSHSATNTPCPLCGREIKKRKPLLLYGHPVCKKCYYGFANRRQAAFIVDSLMFRLLSTVFIVAVAYFLFFAGTAEDTIDRATTILGLALFPVFLAKDGMSGFSPGKALCGVRVVHATSGEPIGLGASLKRNLPLVVPIMPLIIALTMGKGRRIGDGMAKTKVIWNKYAEHPLFSGLAPVVEPFVVPAEAITVANPLPDDDNPYRPPVD